MTSSYNIARRQRYGITVFRCLLYTYTGNLTLQKTLIVTKSVSRFARNTVDSLKTIRDLKKAGCEVYFEKENIFTFDGKGELLLTIMSSLAQEESRSISENVTWGQRRSFESGKVHLAYGRFLGYDRGEDGKPAVNREQALVVELIYRLFLDGKTACGICRELESRGIATPGGGSKWQAGTVESILKNEKYKGDALLLTFCSAPVRLLADAEGKPTTMDEKKLKELDEQLSKDLIWFGVPYAGSQTGNKHTAEQMKANCTFLKEWVKQEQEQGTWDELFTDTYPFL